jgi:hypothetical protein
MEEKHLDKFKIWFDKFVAGFYGEDEYVNANLQMKQQHSKCVCCEMLYLADHLLLDPNQRLIAETIALLHDTGRFPQFLKYRTYSDVRSVSHSALAIEVLREKKVLDVLPENEKSIIEKAIEYHGLKQLPADLSDDYLLFSKMIRDADKLDIFRVVTELHLNYKENKDKFKLEIELPDEPTCSKPVIDAILEEKRIDYVLLKTWNDMKLLMLTWVYDVNFVPTLERIKQRKYLEKIFDFLPDTDDIKKVRRKVFDYVDSRIAGLSK